MLCNGLRARNTWAVVGIVASALGGCKPAPPPASSKPDASALSDAVPAPPATGSAVGSFYELAATALDGTMQPLATYRGKVALVVNTASECGFTPQYAGLEALYRKNRDRGFVVLGFPSNDFGGQEPGSSDEIRKFCTTRYHVTFPMFAKVVVQGAEAAPVYRWLTQRQPPPQWNFHKYLVDRRGAVVASFPSAVTPAAPELQAAIDRALAGVP